MVTRRVRLLAATKTPDNMKTIINGQEFTRIEFTNHGAHGPVTTWYPTEHLAALNSDWREVGESAPAQASQPQAAEPAKAAEVAAPTVDWSVVGPKLAVALEGARKALRVALPHCPADEEHNGPAVLVGEWLDEVNEALALLPSA